MPETEKPIYAPVPLPEKLGEQNISYIRLYEEKLSSNGSLEQFQDALKELDHIAQNYVVTKEALRPHAGLIFQRHTRLTRLALERAHIENAAAIAETIGNMYRDMVGYKTLGFNLANS